MKKIIKLMLGASLCLNLTPVFSQRLDTLRLTRDKLGFIQFAQFNSETTPKLSEASGFLKKIIGAGADEEFRLTKISTDKTGNYHEFFDQYYKGVRVAGTEYLVHGKNGKIESVNGNCRPIETNISVIPAVKESEALQKALATVKAVKYKWEDKSMEDLIKKKMNNPDATFYPKGELAIIRGFGKDPTVAKLVWKFEISTLQPNNQSYVLINAINGSVIANQTMNDDSNVTLNAQTKYSGSMYLTGDSYGGGYRLRETRNSSSIETYDCQHNTLGSAIDYSNSVVDFTSTYWTNFSTNQPALDAHYAAEMVSDYWNTTFGRNGIDNSGLTMQSYYRYYDPLSIVYPNNAEWSNDLLLVYIGEGDGTDYNPFSVFDVLAHEWAHGVNHYCHYIQHNQPAGDESYALNEGLSDIWGAVIENAKTTGKSTWLHGDQLMLNGKACDRNLSDPHNSNANTQGPDVYMGSGWDGGGERHINSLPFSHWFYLLSVGGSGFNSSSTFYNVSGIGITEAAAIVYDAEVNNLFAGAQYTNARDAMISSAISLYGAGSCEERSVTNAWAAVGVGDPYYSQSTYISGSKTLCSSETYAIHNLPSGLSITWSAVPTGIVSLSQSGNSVTLTKIGDGLIRLIASPSTSCSGDVIPNNFYEIGVGNALVATYNVSSNYVASTGNTLIYGGGSVFTRANQSVLFYIPIDGSVSYSGVSWSASGTYSLFYSGSTYAQLYMTTSSSSGGRNASVSFSGTGPCGSVSKTFNFQVVSSGSIYYRMAASPNPASGSINVIISKELDTSQALNQEQPLLDMDKSAGTAGVTRMTLYDFNTNTLVKQWKYDEMDLTTYRLNISGLKSGIYVLKMERDNKTATTKIIVK